MIRLFKSIALFVRPRRGLEWQRGMNTTDWQDRFIKQRMSQSRLVEVIH